MEDKERIQQLKEKMARIMCCFAKENKSCSECRFPDCFPDIRDQTDQIHSLYLAYFKGIVEGMNTESTHKSFEEGKKAGIKEVGLQLRARIDGIDEFMDWSDEGLRQFRKMALQTIKDLLRE